MTKPKALEPDPEFAGFVLGRAVGVEPSDAPHARYDADGDCIEFLFQQEEYRAERVDSLVTVYTSRRTGKIIGSCIKGLRRFIAERAPGLLVQIQDGPVRLDHIFRFQQMATAWPPQSPLWRVYAKLAEEAEKTDAAVDLTPAVAT